MRHATLFAPLALALALGGCSQILGLGEVTASTTNQDATGSGSGRDATFLDAPIDAGPTFTLSGTVSAYGISGMSPFANVAVQLVRSSDETQAIGTATTDANGAFAIQLPTSVLPVDGFLHAVAMDYDDTYLYPVRPWTASDTGVLISMVRPADLDALSSQLCAYSLAGQGMVALDVRDATNQPVSGAIIMSQPNAGKICYDDTNGFPSNTLTQTTAIGVGFLLGVNNTVNVHAVANGVSFQQHAVIARPGTVTQTSIQP